MTDAGGQGITPALHRVCRGQDLSFEICHLSWRFAEVRQFSPVTAGIDPDCAIATECDDLAGR
jgi:hypothetical protein